jgi:hypothetical protein
MNKQIEDHKRRFVVITDPHIASDENYKVFANTPKDLFVKDCE